MPSLDEYCQRLKDLADRLNDVGGTVDDQRLVLQLVRGLPPEFDTVGAYIKPTHLRHGPKHAATRSPTPISPFFTCNTCCHGCPVFRRAWLD